jgi:hypothetical protein
VETDEQVNNLLAMMKEAEDIATLSQECSQVSDWNERRAVRKDQWNSLRLEFSNARTSFESPAFDICSLCFNGINLYAICCKTCKQELCIKCDQNHHSRDPFHQRTFYKKENYFCKALLPTEYVDGTLEVTVRGNLLN